MTALAVSIDYPVAFGGIEVRSAAGVDHRQLATETAVQNLYRPASVLAHAEIGPHRSLAGPARTVRAAATRPRAGQANRRSEATVGDRS